MKKMLSVLLACSMLAGILAGCSSGSKETKTETTAETTEETTAETKTSADTDEKYTVAIVVKITGIAWYDRMQVGIDQFVADTGVQTLFLAYMWL